MKFYTKNDKTALYRAIEKENIEIIKLLLANRNINPNVINISNMIIFIIFKIDCFNDIKEYYLITFNN